jgi:hypothetical protein
MGKLKVQKIIASFTLGAFIFSTILFPLNQVMAGVYDPTGIDLTQYNLHNGSTTPSDESNANYLSDTNTYNLNLETVGTTMSAVIGCTNIVNRVKSGFSDLLNSGKKADTSVLGNTSKPDVSNGSSGPTADKAKSSGGEQQSGSSSGISAANQNVPVQIDKGTFNNIENTKDNTKDTKELTEQNKLREECLNGVAYTLAKRQLAKMTQITVNWINSGFNGDALYIRDRDSYFQSLSDQELLSLVGPLASAPNRYIYPFGRSVAKSIIESQKSKFEDRAQSTLNNALRDGATTESFANNFSDGGWAGWLSLTQNDQNNPLGFGIMTSEELGRRTARKTENAAAELREGNGFLSQKICVEYVNKEDQENSADLFKNRVFNTKLDNYDKNGRECKKWATATPGSIIQNQAANSLTSSTRQLELADSINESLSAVFQALVNQMVNQGLNSLSTFNPNNAPKTLGGEGVNKLYDSLGNDITNLGVDGATGTVLSVKKGSGWYSSGDTFNITTDLGDIMRYDPITKKRYVYKKGVISTQLDYAEAVKVSLKELPKIMPKLGELDYCIPGPNASWETPTKNAINYIIEYLQSLYFSNGAVMESWKDPLGEDAISIISMVSPGFSLVHGILITFKAKADAAYREQYEKRMAAKEAKFEDDRNAAIVNQKESFGWYKDKIDQLYGPTSMMRSTSQQVGYNNPWFLPMAESGLQATKYIRVYDDNIKTATEDYKDLINETSANVYKLKVIKGKVDKIVAAARKRRADEAAKKGIPMIDPSCYDINGVENGNPVTGVTNATPKNGGVPAGVTNGTTAAGTQNPTQATGAAPDTNGGAVSGASPNIVPDFTFTITENRLLCEATITTKNKTVGTATDIYWGVKIGSNPAIYSKKSLNYQETFSTSDQSGSANITLTTKGTNGVTASASKIAIIPKRTVNSLGLPCPK